MPWASNGNTQLLIDFETVYGVSPTPAAKKIPFMSFDPVEDQKGQQSNIIGAGRHAARPFYGNRVVQGVLSGPIDNGAVIGYILKAAFGAPTTTGTADPYTHTFKITSTTPSFILEKGFMDLTIPEYFIYNGCKITGLSFSFTPGGQLKYTANIVAAKETAGTTAFMASPTDLSRPLAIYHSSDALVSEGESAVTNIEELSFDFKNNSVLGYGLSGTGAATSASEGTPTIEGRIKAFFDSMTLLAKGIAHTESSLSVVCTQSTHSFGVYVDELEYDHKSPAITMPGGAYLDLGYIGYFQNAAAASDFRIVLINAQATY